MEARRKPFEERRQETEERIFEQPEFCLLSSILRINAAFPFRSFPTPISQGGRPGHEQVQARDERKHRRPQTRPPVVGEDRPISRQHGTHSKKGESSDGGRRREEPNPREPKGEQQDKRG